VSLARGTKDDGNDQDDRIYAVWSIAVMQCSTPSVLVSEK